jgi:hypothetical protein
MRTQCEAEVETEAEFGIEKGIESVPVFFSTPAPSSPLAAAADVVIGVDPGSASGAVAWIAADGGAGVSDLPLVAGTVDPHRLKALLLSAPQPVAVVFIENVAAMPRQGVSSTFKFGRAVGAIHATIALAGLRLELVTPTTWKKHHHLGADKEKARALALRRWPALADQLARKRDADRAEALLIASYGASR